MSEAPWILGFALAFFQDFVVKINQRKRMLFGQVYVCFLFFYPPREHGAVRVGKNEVQRRTQCSISSAMITFFAVKFSYEELIANENCKVALCLLFYEKNIVCMCPYLQQFK